MSKSQARNEMVGIRITKDMRNVLEQIAQENGVTLSKLIYQLLSEKLSERV